MNIHNKGIIRANGVIPLKQKGYYSIRILSKVGYFSVKDLNIISKIAEAYGSGEVNLTSRLA
ncbi:MAG: nitrite reductase, partial [Sarcina sp.]